MTEAGSTAAFVTNTNSLTEWWAHSTTASALEARMKYACHLKARHTAGSAGEEWKSQVQEGKKKNSGNHVP